MTLHTNVNCEAWPPVRCTRPRVATRVTRPSSQHCAGELIHRHNLHDASHPTKHKHGDATRTDFNLAVVLLQHSVDLGAESVDCDLRKGHVTNRMADT